MPSYPVPDNEVQRLQAVAALAFAADTPDPALEAQPWQAWWRLLTDAPQPTR